MVSQIPLPLHTAPRLGRADFIVGPGNRAAVTFVDAWPDWPASAAALFGPSGSGKSHLAGVWAMRAGAEVVAASDLAGFAGGAALVIEDVDTAPLSPDAETALFALLERGQAMLLTAREPPAAWRRMNTRSRQPHFSSAPRRNSSTTVPWDASSTNSRQFLPISDAGV